MIENVTIDSLAYGGDGVGKLADGRVVFVPHAFPGDVIAVHVEESKKSFARGSINSIVEPCEYRTEPPCALAQQCACGGCPWSQLAYEQQLHWKRQAVVDAFERIAHIDSNEVEQLVAECIPSKKQWNYRNKVEFDANKDNRGRFALGMHRASGGFMPIEQCNLCQKELQSSPKALSGALRYLAGQNDLKIKRAGVRYSKRTGSCEIALWTMTGRFPRAAAAKIVPSSLQDIKAGLTRVLLKGEAKERKVTGVEVLSGKGFWNEKIKNNTMYISAPSFFQVNTAGAETLIDLVLDAMQPSGLDSVFDLYSGAGTFTLPLAEHAREVTAIEAEGSSLRDLRRNLERNDLHAQVIGGDVARELPDLGCVDAVVVDPPRNGLSEKAVEYLLDTKASRIVYVSCNPTTLARDVNMMMVGNQYKPVSIKPVDLFPQTYHVETVCLLEKA